MTGLVLFGLGVVKARFSLSKWWVSGIETLLLGAAVAGIGIFLANAA